MIRRGAADHLGGDVLGVGAFRHGNLDDADRSSLARLAFHVAADELLQSLAHAEFELPMGDADHFVGHFLVSFARHVD